MAIRKGNSNTFYHHLQIQSWEKKIPSRVMFELTYKCNFRCLHCYVASDKRKKELTTNQVFSILDQLKEAGCFHIGFTGGEPLLRKDIFRILNHARKCGFRISLLTNGSLVNPAVARKLANLGTSLNRVDVSVLGATKKTFEKITGQAGSFDRVMNAIQILKDAGVTVQVKTTLLTLNKNEMADIKKLAHALKCLFRYSPTLTRRADGHSDPLRYQVRPLDITNIAKSLSPTKTKDLDSDIEILPVGRENLFHCGAGQTEITISPYGEMNYCLEIHYPQYNILKTSFAECWDKIKKLTESIRPAKKYRCGICRLASFCHWCPAKAWLLKKDFFTCDPQSKKLASVWANLTCRQP